MEREVGQPGAQGTESEEEAKQPPPELLVSVIHEPHAPQQLAANVAGRAHRSAASLRQQVVAAAAGPAAAGGGGDYVPRYTASGQGAQRAAAGGCWASGLNCVGAAAHGFGAETDGGSGGLHSWAN